MIKKIIITKENKSIPKNFELEIGELTVITGENNSGKTNFIKAVHGLKGVEFFDEKGETLQPEIVYIAAENINPSDNECKHSAKTSSLIENLAKLFSNLEVKFELKNKEDIIRDIKILIDRTNINLEGFTGKSKHQLEIDTNDSEIDSSVIIQALIKGITGKEDGVERKLSELGQGTQRIVVASILKAYVDILVERKKHTEKPIIVLFEEPEIYLHPKLKRTLNATLERIAGQENHQVIITTHDPYFVFKNFEGPEKMTFSFTKDDDFTKVVPRKTILGIEDELLFIFLYSFLSDKSKILLEKDLDGFEKREYFGYPTKIHSDLEYIRHQIHHLGDNKLTLGLVSAKTVDCTGKNYYTEDELANAIKEMSERLGSLK